MLAANAKSLWLRSLIACAFAFGFRRGELLGLRVRQIDLLDRWIELEQGTTKNDEGRKVKMTGEVYTLLARCWRGKKPNDYVFGKMARGRPTQEKLGAIYAQRASWERSIGPERSAAIANMSGSICTTFDAQRCAIWCKREFRKKS